MGDSYKLLKIIFVVLFLITLGEFGYYVYISKNQFFQNGYIREDNKITDKTYENLFEPTIKQFLNKFEISDELRITLVLEQGGWIKDIKYDDSTNLPSYLTIADSSGNEILSYPIDHTLQFQKIIGGKKRPSIDSKELQIGQKVFVNDQIEPLNPEKRLIRVQIYEKAKEAL